MIQGELYFYWDIFFLLNFIMNLFLIGMTGLLRRKNIVKRRMLLASFVGSTAMTIGISFQLFLSVDVLGRAKVPGICFLLVTVVIGMVMLQITFLEKKFQELFRDFF